MPRLKRKLNQEEVQRIRSNLNNISAVLDILGWDRTIWIEDAKYNFDEQEYDLVVDNLLNVRNFDTLTSCLEMIKKTIEVDPKEKEATHNAEGKSVRTSKDEYGNTMYDLDDVVDYDEATAKKNLN